MKKTLITIAAVLFSFAAFAATESATSPDGRLKVTVSDESGATTYTIQYDGKTMLESSPLGLDTNEGDFTKLKIGSAEQKDLNLQYSVWNTKASFISKKGKQFLINCTNEGGDAIQIEFRIFNNDVAFRYNIDPLRRRRDIRGSIRVMSEASGFRFPAGTTTFLTPQSDSMIGWKRTKPSYEEEYKADQPMDQRSQYGHGYTYPCLFRVGNDGWVLISETGLDSNYCGTHLSDYENGVYTVALAMPEENNGNGTVEPAFALPGHTPWRTITLGNDLAPMVETTISQDVVEPLYEASQTYKPGRGTWSWIVWQDASMNMPDQVAYVDLAEQMGFEYILVDAGWDVELGYDGVEQLIRYAQSKGVDVFLWYSSSGWWNDITQSPVNKMSNPIARKAEMKWMQKMGVKGIKCDFFGGDKQETIRLYEQILVDANEYGIMAEFHGCTIPRGWERMYPNYVGSEAVLASENMVFGQNRCDTEAFNATLHPFIRNSTASMEFGGCFLNEHISRDNKRGTKRITSDIFQIATEVVFQNPIQWIAITPNNLEDAPQICLDFLSNVPTTWDETKYVAGYPGKYAVLARRHGTKWYLAALNATSETINLDVELPMFAGKEVNKYYDDKNMEAALETVKVKADGKYTISVKPQGATMLVSKR